MMSAIQTYLKQIIAACFLIALLKSIVPAGLTKQIGVLVCGLVLMLVILRPLAGVDLQDVSQLFTKAELESMNFEELDRENTEKIAQLISEKARSYILDKAEELSFTPKEIVVEMKDGEEYPYPYSVSVRGMYTQQQRMELTAWIEANLAIPQKNQTWKWE